MPHKLKKMKFILPRMWGRSDEEGFRNGRSFAFQRNTTEETIAHQEGKHLLLESLKESWVSCRTRAVCVVH